MTAQHPDGTRLTRCRTATVKPPQTLGEAGDPTPRQQLLSGIMTMLAVAMIFISAPTLLLAQSKDTFSNHPTYYRTVRVNGVNIFYREAGPKDAPPLFARPRTACSPAGTDASRNVAWVALMQFTIGESWHQNHHALPGCAQLGWNWRQPDTGFLVIVVLKKLGLASAVRRLPRNRLKAAH